MIGRVFAGHDASLDAPNGGIQAALDGIALISRNLSLHAGAGDIGSASRPFLFELAAGGSLQGSAQGAAILADVGSLRISSFTAGSDLAVTATGNLNAGPLTSRRKPFGDCRRRSVPQSCGEHWKHDHRGG